ncbi:MAG: hypothetical protein WDM76_09470 [Limisphaerales bacterium]
MQIGNDRHLRINGVRLDASTPHFENVYGFDPDKPPRESQFSGHVNGRVAYMYNLYPTLAPLFPDEQTIYTNAPDGYMVMGDNTCNSSIHALGDRFRQKCHWQILLRLLAADQTVWRWEISKVKSS